MKIRIILNVRYLFMNQAKYHTSYDRIANETSSLRNSKCNLYTMLRKKPGKQTKKDS